MKFFEETSRSLSVSNLPSLTCHSQKQLSQAQVKQSGEALRTCQRRYSYQGCAQCPPQVRRPSESSNLEKEDWHHTAVTKQDFKPLSHKESSGPPHMEHYEKKAPQASLQPTTGQESGNCQLHLLGNSHRSRTPPEAHPGQDREQPKLDRKLSLTEGDYAGCPQDLRPAEDAVQRHCDSNWSNLRAANRRSVCNVQEPLEACGQQSRTLPDTERPRTQPNAFSGSPLTDIKETSSMSRKKGPPPPRPPPPKWEEFHRQRASQQNLFYSPSPDPQQSPGNRFPPSCDPEVNRQRSHSLPSGAESDSCQHHSQERFGAPCSPAFMHRAFRPVGSALRETVVPSHPVDPTVMTRRPHPSAESCGVSRDSGTASLAVQDQPALLKHHCTAEWDRGVPLQGGLYAPNGPVMGSMCHQGAQLPQFYLAVNHVEFQQRERSPPNTTDPEQRSRWQEERRPFETDIDEVQDDFSGDEAAAGMQVEVHGFARPATVLETDIDTLPEAEPAPASVALRRCSLVESLLAADAEAHTRASLLQELLPPAVEEDVAGETWRGSCLELNMDSLGRSSRRGSVGARGPGSSCSSHCCSSASLPGTGDGDVEEEQDEQDEEELSYKRQLIESLRKKLAVLREAQRGLQEEVRANTRLGEEVEALVLAVCRPSEVDKFRMLVGDLDKVVSLLLSLSGRLLRVESALDCLGPDASHRERHPLLEKKQLLLSQLGEARELKEHVDRREEAVCRVLGRCLTSEQLRDYGHFVKMKAALLVEQRQLEDKVRLGEEQLRALQESLGPGFGPSVGYSRW